ncbi:hypothetical protein CSA37_03100 [Candidatus Fermentibacteria bacterium]|nr:MAG: hypothetical protein CSA37_03100 [Candidatus Fermentibacteria bacterium]
MFKPADLIILLVIAGVTVFWASSGSRSRGEPECLRVVSEQSEDTLFLSCDTVVTRGQVVIEIKDGTAAITASDCPNRLCVQAGWLKETGQLSACMPNRVFIQILGNGTESKTDVISY